MSGDLPAPALAPALAIETSQRGGGVALAPTPGTGGEVLVERFEARHGRDDRLLPAIERLRERAGIATGDLGLVGVSVGPGSFTGVRIGVTTARMIGEITGATLVAVPSAIAVAHTHAADIEPSAQIVVILAVKRGSFWATRLRRTWTGTSSARRTWTEKTWTPTSPPGLADAATLDLDGVAAVLADAHLPADARARCDAAGVAVIEPRFEPEGVLAAATCMGARGVTVDPLRLEPLYPRRPEAVTIWEQRLAERGGDRAR